MRAGVVGGLVALATVAGCSGSPDATDSSTPAATAPASAVPTPTAGRRLVFSDDFTSASSIDLTGTGQAGHRWFTDRPFDWGRTPAKDLSVKGGILTINPSDAGNNFGIATVSASSHRGTGFRFGYFEARMAFDPSAAARSDGFPAFWGLSVAQMRGADLRRTYELDFFEAMNPDGKAGKAYQGTFAGTVHDLQLFPQVDRANYGNNIAKLGPVDFTAFHTYGCLWTKGELRWYFDGVQVLQQRYSATGVPDPNPQQLGAGMFSGLDEDASGQALVLGTGRGYPLRVDWVHVWQ